MGRKALLKELEKLDVDFDVDELLAQWRDEAMCQRTYTDDDVADPGDEVGIGEYGRVEYDDLGMVERIILPDNNLLPVHFLEEGATKQRAVARVARKSPHGGWGTGWMVGRDLMMTNNHVISTPAQAAGLQAEFNYQLTVDGAAQTPDVYQFDPDGFFYTNAALDFTLIKVRCKPLVLQLPLKVEATDDGQYLVLDEAAIAEGDAAPVLPGVPAGPIVPTMPGVVTPRLPIPRPPIFLCYSAGSRWGRLQLPTGTVTVADDQHINIVQHPQGRRKEVAVQQNRLTNIYANHLRYTTDTEPGSSGSPVFDNGWDLLAIHHAGGERVNGVWINNQGVRIDRIVADIRANHPAGSWVRTQLGV